MVQQSPSSRPAPALVGFIDSFLCESNIKWLLATGAAILLASSLMLVVAHWGDYTPSWKYLIMLLYTGAIYRAGLWVNERLLLRKTGSALLALSVFLLPALFAVLHWIGIESDLLRYALFALTLVFSVLAADRTFTWLLHSRQMTFLVCYQALSAAFFLLPALPVNTVTAQGLALWLILCIGTAKASRHVFWLGEKRQMTRLFGFFPVVLLGAQFLGFFALNIASSVRIEWLGLACALLAVPILLSADAAARVFDQRSGMLILRRPAAVVLPMITALLLALSGVGLSFAGLLAQHSPLAITPTALIVALIVAVVARRTRLQACVWIMLVMVAIAYNFAPFYFTELALRVANSGAGMMREARLPLAFYGLTYLPLIIALSIVAHKNGAAKPALVNAISDKPLWGPPCRSFAVLLGGILLALSTSHGKAMFLVPLALLPLLVVQTVIFRLPLLALVALAAFILSASSAGAFFQTVFDWRGILAESWLWLSIAAGLLWLWGDVIDQRLSAMMAASAGHKRRFRALQISSLMLCLYLATEFIELRFFVDHALLQALVLASLLLMHSLRWQSKVLAFLTIVFAYFAALAELAHYHFEFGHVLSLVTLALFVQWLFAYIFRALPAARISKTFAAANAVVVGCAFVFLAVFVYFPLMLADLLGFSSLLSGLWPWHSCHLLVIAWLIDSGRVFRRGWLAMAGALGAVLFVSGLWLGVFDRAGLVWLPLLWTVLAGLTLVLCVHSKIVTTTLRSAFEQVSTALLFATALLALFDFDWQTLGAGMIAASALSIFAGRKDAPVMGALSAILLNWQLFSLVIAVLAPSSLTEIHQLASVQALPLMLPIALVAALSTYFWHRRGLIEQGLAARLCKAQGLSLHALIVFTVLQSLQLDKLSLSQATMALLVFSTLFWRRFRRACEKSSEAGVWLAMLILGTGLAYFFAQEWLRFGGGWSLLMLSASAVCAHFVAAYTGAKEHLAVSARPFQQLALLLPVLCVLLALFRVFMGLQTLWIGQNSLALFIASGFYFFLAYDKRRSLLLSASAIIANLAFALLWYELEWSDPQFFLVPLGVSVLGLRYLLSRQLPLSFQTPLNYAGALIVLVSPLFNIAQGSWLHIFTLMLCAVGVVLVGIGLRLRALLYTGSAFLAVALISMLVRGAVDEPNLLWISGLLLGAAVVFLGALAERNRENLLQRVRMLSATLNSWE